MADVFLSGTASAKGAAQHAPRIKGWDSEKLADHHLRTFRAWLVKLIHGAMRSEQALRGANETIERLRGEVQALVKERDELRAKTDA
jgi:hypothetical protein